MVALVQLGDHQYRATQVHGMDLEDDSNEIKKNLFVTVLHSRNVDIEVESKDMLMTCPIPSEGKKGQISCLYSPMMYYILISCLESLVIMIFHEYHIGDLFFCDILALADLEQIVAVVQIG
jgi:hypothetical protein